MYHVLLYIHREKFMPGLLLRLIIFVAGRAELKAFKKALILWVRIRAGGLHPEG